MAVCGEFEAQSSGDRLGDRAHPQRGVDRHLTTAGDVGQAERLGNDGPIGIDHDEHQTGNSRGIHLVGRECADRFFQASRCLGCDCLKARQKHQSQQAKCGECLPWVAHVTPL